MIGNDFYLILRGSVTYCSEGKTKQIGVGKCFGKVFVLVDNAFRSKHTYKAIEDCELACISYNSIKEVIIKPAKKEFIKRIFLLRDVEYIRGLNPYASAILALNGSVKTYYYGNVILRQGKQPGGFFVVYEGRCACVYDTILKRSEEVHGNEITPKHFNFSLLDSKEILKSQKQYRNFGVKRVERSFANEQLKLTQVFNQRYSKIISYRIHVLPYLFCR